MTLEEATEDLAAADFAVTVADEAVEVETAVAPAKISLASDGAEKTKLTGMGITETGFVKEVTITLTGAIKTKADSAIGSNVVVYFNDEGAVTDEGGNESLKQTATDGIAVEYDDANANATVDEGDKIVVTFLFRPLKEFFQIL